jgi:nucleoside-diphosphate-sugar epimerase
MRILITGANGYVGKSLYNALKDKYDVTAITRDSFDLTNPIAMSKFFQSRYPFDVVLHCAVAGATNPRNENWEICDSNLIMYYNLLQSKGYYKRLIHFGSGAETYLPSTPYGYSKKVIAKSILNQDNFYNVKIFGVFDENELDTRFIKANIKRYINKEPIKINEVKFMDFFYMQDLIKVIEYYISEEKPPKEFDCVYSENSYTLFGLACLINKLDDYEVEVVYGDKIGDDYLSKYRTPLPIELIGLEQGIKNVYNKLK